jgi:hypothetical protein
VACPSLSSAGGHELSSSRRGGRSGHHYIMGLAPVLRETVIEEKCVCRVEGQRQHVEVQVS